MEGQISVLYQVQSSELPPRCRLTPTYIVVAQQLFGNCLFLIDAIFPRSVLLGRLSIPNNPVVRPTSGYLPLISNVKGATDVAPFAMVNAVGASLDTHRVESSATFFH